MAIEQIEIKRPEVGPHPQWHGRERGDAVEGEPEEFAEAPFGRPVQPILTTNGTPGILESDPRIEPFENRAFSPRVRSTSTPFRSISRNRRRLRAG